MKKRPLAEADALKIVASWPRRWAICTTTVFVHRDLKPENIMICCDRTLAGDGFRARLPLPAPSPRSGQAHFQSSAPRIHGAGAGGTWPPFDEPTDIYGLGVFSMSFSRGRSPLAIAGHLHPRGAVEVRLERTPCLDQVLPVALAGQEAPISSAAGTMRGSRSAARWDPR